MDLHRTAYLLVSLAVSGLVCLPASVVAGRLDQSLAEVAASSGAPDSTVSVLVLLDNQQIERSLNRVAYQPDLTRAERIKVVTAHLKSEPSPEAVSVEQFLHHNATAPITRHWIIPAFTAEVPASKLVELAALPGVHQVVPDVSIELTAPTEIYPSPSTVTAISSALQLLGVPSLWQKGVTGKGRLVCSFDTGVERIHAALSPKWRGNHSSLREAWFSKVAPDSIPYDKAGHGTHTMGVMVGSTATDSFGVAPGAEWICAAVIDQGPDLTTTISHILEAFEWTLDPDGNPATTDDVPDVILNSWGLPTMQPSALAPCSTIFWQAIDNVEAAGIVTIFAAGNEGKSGAKTIRNPANRATTPYNSFCVGAVNDQKVIADFSSRGPSACDTTQVKPEVVAPGVGIRSSYRGGTYMTMSGTSMAAPFIAGLVALCRQYNPDATVEQIKYAFMMSATDLGPTGEDNAYGWGLVDAARLLQFLPAPSSVHLSVVNTSILGDGIAMPGETFGLQVYIANAAGNVDLVKGELVALDSTSTIVVSQSSFIFGIGGTVAVNGVPFQITLGADLLHGMQVPLKLRLSTSAGVPLDSAIIRLTAGYAVPGDLITHHTGLIDFTTSDFGQCGLSEGSLYNAGGEGFRFSGSENLLYEAGLIVGRSSVQLSTAIRDSSGRFRPSDFRPDATAASWVAEDGSTHQAAAYSDVASPLPIPVKVHQESIQFLGDGDRGFVVMKYNVVNSSLERLTGFYVGFLADFDLSSSDTVSVEPGLGLMYQQGAAGPLVGLVALEGAANFSALANGLSKTGFSTQQQYSLISFRADRADSSPAGDKMMLLHSGPYGIAPQDSMEIVFAIVAGSDRDELLANAVRVRELYGIVTDVADEEFSTPGSFELRQNYPNPFNPSTTISFSIARGAHVTVDVFNMLGQRVTRLVDGELAAGNHLVTWQGDDQQGNPAAAGVYFYRVTAGQADQTRKMVLLK